MSEDKLVEPSFTRSEIKEMQKWNPDVDTSTFKVSDPIKPKVPYDVFTDKQFEVDQKTPKENPKPSPNPSDKFPFQDDDNSKKDLNPSQNFPFPESKNSLLTKAELEKLNVKQNSVTEDSIREDIARKMNVDVDELNSKNLAPTENAVKEEVKNGEESEIQKIIKENPGMTREQAEYRYATNNQTNEIKLKRGLKAEDGEVVLEGEKKDDLGVPWKIEVVVADNAPENKLPEVNGKKIQRQYSTVTNFPGSPQIGIIYYQAVSGEWYRKKVQINQDLANKKTIYDLSGYESPTVQEINSWMDLTKPLIEDVAV